jgi:hypothetical protein
MKNRYPIVPWVRCADPACDKVLAQRRLPWRGDPMWIMCRGCKKINRVSAESVRIVSQVGDD